MILMIRVHAWESVSKYDKATEDPEVRWDAVLQIEGESKVVAGALRALADKLDPPKTEVRY